MWINHISEDEASGLVKKEYDHAVKRSGRVSPIVKIMSLNPSVMSASIRFYTSLMFGPSPLTRMQRELLATVVSIEMQCPF